MAKAHGRRESAGGCTHSTSASATALIPYILQKVCLLHFLDTFGRVCVFVGGLFKLGIIQVAFEDEVIGTMIPYASSEMILQASCGLGQDGV